MYSEGNFVSFETSNSLHLVEVLIIAINDPDVLDALWFHKLSQFLANFKHSKLLTWGFKSDQVCFVPRIFKVFLFFFVFFVFFLFFFLLYIYVGCSLSIRS